MKPVESKQKPKSRIFVIEDHPLFCEALVQLINREKDMVCCGQANGADSAMKAVPQAQPDLVILDLRLPDADGLEVIKSLRDQLPDLAVLALTQLDETIYAERVLRAGARGYVMKQQATEEVRTAIRTVLGGDLYLSNRMAVRLLQHLIRQPPANDSPGMGKLTDRELRVFEMFGAGMSTRDIADKLKLSSKTVEAHRENIKHKLGLPDAAAVQQNARAWVDGQPQP